MVVIQITHVNCLSTTDLDKYWWQPRSQGLFPRKIPWKRSCTDDCCITYRFQLNNYQNPSLFLFLMLIRAIVLSAPLGIQNLNKKKEERNSDSCRQITTTCKSIIMLLSAVSISLQYNTSWTLLRFLSYTRKFLRAS